MKPARKRRLAAILLIVLGVGAATGLMLSALNQNMLYYIHPSDLATTELPPDRQFRLGGFVMQNSVRRSNESLLVEFEVTDCQARVPIRFEGILPDLFREGEAIIAIGSLGDDGVFNAGQVLAKHDENYMPPEVAESVKQGGPLCAAGEGPA